MKTTKTRKTHKVINHLLANTDLEAIYFGSVKECETYLYDNKKAGIHLQIIPLNTEELLSANRKEKQFYIQAGYVGNSILWWGINSRGYTTNIQKAGRYSEEETMKIINNRPDIDMAWSCEHVDNNESAKITTVYMQYLDIEYLIEGKKE